jgi:hypothetical protein
MAVVMSASSLARAGVWGAEPVFGVSGDYSSNPALLPDLPHPEETHAAVLLDAPTSYIGDAFKLSIQPSFRFGNSSGYASTDSDYEHLNAKAEFDTERSILSVAAGVARDSTLYRDYQFNGSVGVRRDGTTADLDWDRQLSERLDWNTDLNAIRVRYGAAVGAPTLTDYQYASLSPTVSYSVSELNKFTVSAAAGRYASLDGLTHSTNYNLQLGLVRQFDPLWSLSGSAGYSRAINTADVFSEFLVFVQGVPQLQIVTSPVKSTQNGTVFALSLTRQSALWSMSAVASRQLAPTGFAYLSRQDSYELKSNYQASARWSYGAGARWVRYQYPELQPGAAYGQTSSYVDLSANWLWTEHWTITVNASRLMTHASGARSIGATGCSIELARHFDWKTFR